MIAGDHGNLPSLNETIARLQDETDQAQTFSHLGGVHYQRWRAKLDALVAARTEYNRLAARRDGEETARRAARNRRDTEAVSES